MAIQAQIYPDCSGFTQFMSPEFHEGGGGVGGGAVWMNHHQRPQLHPNKVSRETETPTFCSYEPQFAKQSFQIDHFIISQNERLRRMLQELRKRDVTELLTKIEARTSYLLNQKDEEITKAKARTTQLESLLMKLQTDIMTWQQVAKQNELQVISLNNTIQLLQQQLHQSNEPLVEDSESCCDEQHQQVDKNVMLCRVCERREVSVVMLPCRHMCACSVCDPMTDSCPVCRMDKKGSVEAMFC